MLVLSPCKPPLLGSFILCRITWSSSSSKWLGTGLLAVLEFLMAMQSIIGGVHYESLTQISGIVLLWEKCQEFMNSKENTNKVDFLVRGYRELQIHEKIHNSIYKSVILPVTMLIIPLIQVFTGFAMIQLFREGVVFLSFVFLVFYLDTIFFCFCVFTTASFINVRAEEWLTGVKGRGGKNEKYLRRIRKSFRFHWG